MTGRSVATRAGRASKLTASSRPANQTTALPSSRSDALWNHCSHKRRHGRLGRVSQVGARDRASLDGRRVQQNSARRNGLGSSNRCSRRRGGLVSGAIIAKWVEPRLSLSLLPLSEYTAPGGLRPGPSRAAGSPATKCVERGYDRACGGDRWRRSDGIDVGGRVGVGGRRRCHCRAARQPGPHGLARWLAVCTHAPSRSSISAESPLGSSRRERYIRSCAST